MHPVAARLPRNERRMWERDALRAWKTGKWGAWELTVLPNGVPGGNGWTRDVRAIYRSAPLWAVLLRPFKVKLDGADDVVLHLSITNALALDVTWAQKQRIKNEIVGGDRLAVEVFPTMDRLVDAAPAYHLWVYPAGYMLPFGLKDEEVQR